MPPPRCSTNAGCRTSRRPAPSTSGSTCRTRPAGTSPRGPSASSTAARRGRAGHGLRTHGGGLDPRLLRRAAGRAARGTQPTPGTGVSLRWPRLEAARGPLSPRTARVGESDHDGGMADRCRCSAPRDGAPRSGYGPPRRGRRGARVRGGRWCSWVWSAAYVLARRGPARHRAACSHLVRRGPRTARCSLSFWAPLRSLRTSFVHIAWRGHPSRAARIVIGISYALAIVWPAWTVDGIGVWVASVWGLGVIPRSLRRRDLADGAPSRSGLQRCSRWRPRGRRAGETRSGPRKL